MSAGRTGSSVAHRDREGREICRCARLVSRGNQDVAGPAGQIGSSCLGRHRGAVPQGLLAASATLSPTCKPSFLARSARARLISSDRSDGTHQTRS